jgi:hypothetical protein
MLIHPLYTLLRMSARKVPSSIGQRLLWLVDHYRGQDGALNCPVLLRLRGPLDTAALQSALDQLSARHETLRTTFIVEGRDLIQLIHDPKPFPLENFDLSEMIDSETAVQQRIANELRMRIDATTWPVRGTLWRVRETDHVLCINMHHLVADAWSCRIVFEDLRRLLDRIVFGGPPLPQITWQYSQFIEWQQQELHGQQLRSHQDYWCKQLEGATLPLWPNKTDHENVKERRSASESIDIDSQTVAALSLFARKRRTTLFNVMLASYYVLLHQLTGQADLAIASLFANRLRPELQNTVGFVANMVILRTSLPKGATFTDLINETHATVTGAFLHQQVPYYILPGNVIQDRRRRPDDVVFQVLAEPVYNANLAGAEVEVLVPDGVGNRFELELALIPLKEGFKVVLFYNQARLDRAGAREFISRYANLVTLLSAQPNIALAKLNN